MRSSRTGPDESVGPSGESGERRVGTGGWRPRAVLGATSPGGLSVPAADPTASWMYAPRSVWTDGRLLVVADAGNNRVLLWHRVPDRDGVPADVVLGQPDLSGQAPSAGGPRRGLHLPTGVLVHQGRLLVADAWHHRILIWDTVPQRHATEPDRVIGQPDLASVEPNRGGGPAADSFYWPFGIAMVDGRLYVADTGNRRVLVWPDGIPDDGAPARVVLGQPDFVSREENRGGGPAADSFRWPHAITGTGTGGVLVADAGNHRVLRWDVHPERDLPAGAVLGQQRLTDNDELPHQSQAGRLRFPYGISTAGRLVVADTANSRVLVFDDPTAVGAELPTAVLGQAGHHENGENRWDAVTPDSLCWPYGVHLHDGGDDRGDGSGDLIAVADSGNNRVVLWERRPGVRRR